MKDKTDNFIYNQRKIPKEQWRYGFRTSAATGCGWIATYNALCFMGRKAEPKKLIRYFERQVPFINGNFGTFLLGPAIYFLQRGYKVRVSLRRNKFDEMAKNSDAAILFYYWRRKCKFGAHFVAFRYEDGKFIGYNTFGTSTGPDNCGSSLETFIKQRKYFGAVLTTIREVE
uniref:hypothetical protein n=1 Tax=Acetatifactor sp. TaxID=1872090 RepID=UPI0040565A8C